MVAIKNRYIGIPYEKLRCWELICHYYANELGIALPTHENNYRDENDQKTISMLYRHEIALKRWLEVDKPKYPDIAVFKINGHLWHCGIVVGNMKMLHTQRGCQSVIESYKNARWKNRLYGFFRYQAKQE